MSTSLNIKNLSIALEALSRMPGVEDSFDRIKGILDREIDIASEEQAEQIVKDIRCKIKERKQEEVDNDIPF